MGTSTHLDDLGELMSPCAFQFAAIHAADLTKLACPQTPDQDGIGSDQRDVATPLRYDRDDIVCSIK